MDQPAIYSETVREGIVCVWRLAFGVRRLAFARRQRNGSKPARQIRMGKNSLGAPSFSPYRFSAARVGTFPGAACKQPTDLLTYKAAPLQTRVINHQSPITFSLLTSHAQQCSPGNGY